MGTNEFGGRQMKDPYQVADSAFTSWVAVGNIYFLSLGSYKYKWKENIKLRIFYDEFQMMDIHTCKTLSILPGA